MKPDSEALNSEQMPDNFCYLEQQYGGVLDPCTLGGTRAARGMVCAENQIVRHRNVPKGLPRGLNLNLSGFPTAQWLSVGRKGGERERIEGGEGNV